MRKSGYSKTGEELPDREQAGVEVIWRERSYSRSRKHTGQVGVYVGGEQDQLHEESAETETVGQMTKVAFSHSAQETARVCLAGH